MASEDGSELKRSRWESTQQVRNCRHLKKKLIARLAGSEASEGREGVIDETVISDMIWPMETLTRQSQVSCSYNVRRYPADCLT